MKRASLVNKQTKKPDEIDPKVSELIEKISKKYAGVWRDLAKL